MDTSGQPNIAIFAHEAGSVGTTVASISTWVATTTTRGNLGWSGEAWEGGEGLSTSRGGVGEAEPQAGRLVTSSSLVMLLVKRSWRGPKTRV